MENNVTTTLRRLLIAISDDQGSDLPTKDLLLLISAIVIDVTVTTNRAMLWEEAEAMFGEDGSDEAREVAWTWPTVAKALDDIF